MFSTPPPTSVVVTVQAGNTLSAIAQVHGVTWEAVWQDNRDTITDPNVIYVGESVRVPTASPSSLPVKPTSSVPVTPTPPPGPSGNSQPTSGQADNSSSLDNVPGVPEKFAACVAYRESTDLQNPAAHNNAYGIIAASGYNVAGDSIEAQKQVFATLWKDDGQWRPWLADGCPQHFGYSNDWSADESSNSGPWGAS